MAVFNNYGGSYGFGNSGNLGFGGMGINFNGYNGGLIEGGFGNYGMGGDQPYYGNLGLGGQVFMQNGGGGGGVSHQGGSDPSGAGAKGVVIVRYPN